MSNEPKKYPADTPVTLEMLVDILRKVSAKSPTAEWLCESVKEHIEPSQPEPKDGEIWLCKNGDGDMTAMWRISGGWSFWSDGAGEFGAGLIPIKRLMPAEDIDE